MGCASCGIGVDKDGKVKGCNNNGGCESGGCNRLNVFDWLSDMSFPSQEQFDIVEIRFKGGRKGVLPKRRRVWRSTQGIW